MKKYPNDFIPSVVIQFAVFTSIFALWLLKDYDFFDQDQGQEIGNNLGILGNSLVSAAPAAGAPADAESPVSLAFRIDLRKPTHHVGRQRGLSTSPGFRCQELSDQISKYMNDIIDGWMDGWMDG